jgi:hypothetical protein
MFQPEMPVEGEKEGKELKCTVCDREASENVYCKFHGEAYENIVKKYDSWKRALGISWKEYLSEIAKNPLTGQWAKETAEHLIKSGEKEDVAQG